MGICNTAELTAVHRRFAAALRHAAEAEMRSAARAGEQDVHERPLFKPRTGALQRETSGIAQFRSGGGIVRLLNRKRYAAAIDRGARPHTIVPRRAAALVFFWPKVGHVVRLQRVRHPGNRPYHFLRRAWSVAYRQFGVQMARRMATIAARF